MAADGSTLLHACVSRDAHVSLEIILSSFNSSSSSSSSSVVNTKSSSGLTPLHLAAKLNRLTCTSLLLSRSADVNAVTDESQDCNTPLLLAAANGSNDVVPQLLAAGADVSHVNRLGLTVLHVAAASGNTFALAAVISHIKVSQKTAASQPSSHLHSLVSAASLYGDTPLHLCALSTGVPPLKALKCGLLLLQVNSCTMQHVAALLQ